MTPTAATRVACVIGDPVRHSLSPVLHNAAFEALGLDWVYVAFEVPAAELPAAVSGFRALGVEGVSVTMPHKSAIARLVDRVSPIAERLGAVNTVARRADGLVGDNTDGAGFVASLREDEGFDPGGKRCLVVGAGGAARAVILALAEAGARDVVVVNRTPERGVEAATLAGPVGRVGSAREAGACDLVVNATPVGMTEQEALPVDPADLGPGQLVADLVYWPPVTPLLAAARARGAHAVNGLGMLIHQAGHQFRLWTGEDAPLPAMSAAALAALARNRPDQG